MSSGVDLSVATTPQSARRLECPGVVGFGFLDFRTRSRANSCSIGSWSNDGYAPLDDKEGVGTFLQYMILSLRFICRCYANCKVNDDDGVNDNNFDDATKDYFES